MADNNFFANNPFADSFKSFSENVFANAKFPAFDFSKLTEAQSRNVAAFTAANEIVRESLQASVRRQAEIAQANIGESLHVIKEALSSGNPEASAAKHVELAKSLLENNLSSASELLKMSSKSNIEALDLLNQRLAEAFGEIGEGVSKASPAAKKKKAA